MTRSSRAARAARAWLLALAGTALLMAANAHAASFMRMSSLLDDPRLALILWELSGDGSTAAGTISQASSPLEPSQEAIRWTQDGGIQRLGFLPGGQVSEAYVLTPDGSRIAGYSQSTAGVETFVWNEGSGMQPIEAPATEPIDRSTLPRSLTADGQTLIGRRTIGWVYDDARGENLPIVEPFVWTANEGLRSLGELDASLAGASLAGISRDGATLIGQMGGVDEFGIGHGPFFIRTEGQPLEIVDLPQSATPLSTLSVRLSGDGSTLLARFHAEDGSTSGFESAIYRREMGWVPLPAVDGVDATLYPGSLSADGRVVTGYVERFVQGEFVDTAVLWDPDHGLRPLKDELEAQGLDLTGIDLTHATSISDDGSTIAGLLRDANGRFDSFVAVIPEPGPAVLLGLGLAALRGFAPPARAATARCIRGKRHSGDR